ncbi:Peptidoglycan-binding (PGRP) domain of peptidoglycan hydrolases-containing protein [Nocardioides exalbidus]|uniref:Peptidoglycan-binding (PGRP) domain of peptidoglycan hydrolases-containing protein n=1 Tax=Nocardioides exalbidus TaxID=402596 RepID=A0A1H4Y2A2_9ACTN|nr:glycoside hydrolase domain-containing protein [Nocardioides exalbidus]SED11937.1 Peptidoglycan-binding (PGRP) domain of peptidoglycan hydrolases-containing protein [Nocardioides exalbidus]
MHAPASPARLTVVAAVVLAFCATLLVGGGAEAAGSKDGLTGYAFDARCAPTQEQMDAWLTSSPFWGVGIYIGGSTASCQTSATDPGQPHLDATWVSRQRSSGWRVLPIWVGPQAACSSYADLIDPNPAGDYAAADARGRAEATAAVVRARELGIKARTTLWYDLEGGFDVADEDCRRSALRFLSGWTEALHDLRYRSGVYSSISAGIHALDNADNLSPGSYEMPDQVWFAWDNDRANVDVDQRWVRKDSWEGERIHQYQLHTDAAYGGVALTIDRNFLELDGGSQPPRNLLACGRTDLDLRSYPRLRTGRSGDAVEALQCLLRKHAGYRSRLDGRYDTQVARAVRKFQRRHDLRQTGRTDPATWTALFAQGSKPLVKVGSSGDAALRLERALRAAGFGSVKVTGVVTDRTTRAVARCQRRVGLDPTGVVTTDTWKALQTGAR